MKPSFPLFYLCPFLPALCAQRLRMVIPNYPQTIQQLSPTPLAHKVLTANDPKALVAKTQFPSVIPQTEAQDENANEELLLKSLLYKASPV